MGMNKDHSWVPCYHNEDGSSNPYNRNHENVNPDVYRVEDGHAYEESFWPTLKERHECALCGSLEHLHIQASGDTEFSHSELDTIREGYWHP